MFMCICYVCVEYHNFFIVLLLPSIDPKNPVLVWL